ncbi:MAG: LiaI-LiaF-like domain-containing protein [Candidatus Woesearchaeota archaeon]
MSKKDSEGDIVTGIILIFLGLFFIFRKAGVISISLGELFVEFWPVFLIFIGLSIVIKNRWVIIISIFILLIVAAVSLFSGVGEQRELEQTFPIDSIITHLDVDIDYGAGDIKISKGTGALLKNEITTYSLKDPVFITSKDNTRASVEIKREESAYLFSGNNLWNIEVFPLIPVDLDLDYGVVSADIDLRDLNVRNLDIDCGMTSTEIIFGNSPTKASIKTGMSSFVMTFPEDSGVKIEVNSGFAAKDFDGFRKEGNIYYSEDYDENENNIEVKIDAGFSSLEADFYS